jgi:hypothetical protein
MLYYVRSGDVYVSLHAKNHRQAAIKTLDSASEDLGVCVVVSQTEINDENIDDNVYFLTDSILEDCHRFRLVD